jgi:predicted metalloprotease
MTFNPNADISGGKTRKRGRTAGIAAGGVGLGAVAVLLLSQLLGVDLTGIVGGASSQTQEIGTGDTLENCKTGADANADIE